MFTINILTYSLTNQTVYNITYCVEGEIDIFLSLPSNVHVFAHLSLLSISRSFCAYFLSLALTDRQTFLPWIISYNMRVQTKGQRITSKAVEIMKSKYKVTQIIKQQKKKVGAF